MSKLQEMLKKLGEDTSKSYKDDTSEENTPPKEGAEMSITSRQRVKNSHREKLLEMISIDELFIYSKDLANWLKEITKYNLPDGYLLIFKDIQGYENNKFKIKFWTENYEYAISVKLPRVKKFKVKDTYLGCTVSCRKPLVGEDWTRGSDLADGKFTKDTMRSIERDIIANEMKPLEI